MRERKGAFGHLLNRKKEEALSHFPIIFNTALHPPASFPGAWFRARCECGKGCGLSISPPFWGWKYLPLYLAKVSLAESTQSG